MTIRQSGLAVTHDGAFHADEVFATAVLTMAVPELRVCRTRDPETIAQAEIVYDVGGTYDPADLRFDHHMASPPLREDGTPYSSAGLVWREFGAQAIRRSGPIAGTDDLILAIRDQIDQEFVRIIDRVDNGVENIGPTDVIAVIGRLNPTHLERGGDDAQAIATLRFNQAVDLARDILIRLIRNHAAVTAGEAAFLDAVGRSDDSRLAVLDTYTPWQKAVFSNGLSDLLYVVAPSGTRGQWGVSTVPAEMGSFENRKSLPANWAGLTDQDLQAVSGVHDAVFCHRNLFIAVAGSKEGALKLAQKALAA